MAATAPHELPHVRFRKGPAAGLQVEGRWRTLSSAMGVINLCADRRVPEAAVSNFDDT